MKKINLILVSTALILTGCAKNNNQNKNEDNKKTNYETKKTKFKKDTTTEVLVDKEIKKDDIEKVVKHGDHWHVFTKDGKEHITYSDPSKVEYGENISLVSVVSSDKLKDIKNITSIKKHGDHYHIYTEDGKEVLTYENPSKLYPNIVIGNYEGSHSDNTVLNNIPSPNKLVYENEEKVVKILKHGDHYHIYTADGSEFVSYTDPRAKYPNATYGKYEGSHKENNSNESHIGHNHHNKNEEKNEIIKVSKHGDHWHIITSDGKEFSSTVNPKILYPNTIIIEEEYNDLANHNHNHNHEAEHKEEGHNHETEHKEDIPKSEFKIIDILGKEKVDRNDIVKILKHGDHYHIFDSKGNEGLTYEDPSKYYPNAQVGEYDGEHTEENEEKLPENITKIVIYNDSWQLFSGDKLIKVVQSDPTKHYKEVEIIDERKNNNNTIKLTGDDIVIYDEVPAELVEKVVPYLSNNLKAMRNFGDLRTNKAVFGSDGVTRNIFYWLHGDHYHAISLKQIIQKAKAGEFGDNTAQDVIATLKYIIKNPNTYIEAKVVVEFEEVQKFLMDYYNIIEKTRVMFLYNNVDIHKDGKTITIHLSKFDKKDGKIIYKDGELPDFNAKEEKVKKEEVVEEPKEEVIETPTISEKPKEEKTKEKTPEELAKEKELLDNNYETEKEILTKLSSILGISEEDAFDRIYEVIDDVDNFRVIDLTVNEDGIVVLNGKKYDLKIVN